MKKLITGVAVAAAAVLVPATPAFAIHDPFVPAGVCAASANSVGIPARTHAAVEGGIDEILALRTSC
jgi:hypothetical protein